MAALHGRNRGSVAISDSSTDPAIAGPSHGEPSTAGAPGTDPWASALRLIGDALPIGLVQFGPDQTTVQHLNSVARQMLGLVADDFGPQTIAALEQLAVQEDGQPWPGNAAPVARHLVAAVAAPTVMGLRHPSGEIQWVVVRRLQLDDSAGQGSVLSLIDINERKRFERALRDSEAKYQQLLQVTDLFVVCLDLDGRITRANERAARVFHSAPGLLLGRTFAEVLDSDALVDAYHARYKHVRETGETVEVEEVVEIDGRMWWFASTTTPLLDVSGSVNGVQMVARDVSSKRRAEIALRDREERSRHEALHDPLTRLPNRLLFMDRLDSVVRSRPTSTGTAQFAVLCLDLDRFKNINDSLGHSAGDKLLIDFSRRLRDCIGPEDILARLGGDEFAILLRHIHDASDAIRVADQVLNLLRQPFSLRGQDVYVPTSVGIALGGNVYERPEDVLRDADTAMYRAKRRGKGRYELFNATMHTEAVALLTLENDLRRAIERGEFEVYYQPVIDFDTSKITGFEALLRWNHPTRGVVAPGDFIGCAEETGLIVPIGEWVLCEACRQMQRWHAKYPGCGKLAISVNLSGKQFSQPMLIGKALRDSALTPSSLKLEITESVIMEDPQAASTLLEQLQRQEVQSYVDDFGTGYSSLSYLHRFPMSALKIDRSFVTNIGPNGENAAIVQTIVTLAHNLGMSVIAEGVETAAQLDLLRHMGCEFGQGFYFSRPVIATEAEKMIARQSASHHDTTTTSPSAWALPQTPSAHHE